jgi:hypothetical protein
MGRLQKMFYANNCKPIKPGILTTNKILFLKKGNFLIIKFYFLSFAVKPFNINYHYHILKYW